MTRVSANLGFIASDYVLCLAVLIGNMADSLGSYCLAISRHIRMHLFSVNALDTEH